MTTVGFLTTDIDRETRAVSYEGPASFHYSRRASDDVNLDEIEVGDHAGIVDGRALCRMFNHAIRGLSRPKRLSSDHDPTSRMTPAPAT